MSAIPKKMKNSRYQWEANQLNNDTYNMYYSMLKNMCLSLFKWEGLPKTVNERFLETTLFESGHCGFVKDPQYGFLGLPSNLTGMVNMYGEPITLMAISNNYSREFTVGEDAVVIYHNNLKEPTEQICRLYSMRLYEVERTLDTNIKQQKFPLVILCNDQQRLSLKNLYMQYDGNEPVIFAHKTLDLDGVKVLNTDAPFIADKLINYKHNLMNECMMNLGISNFNQMKKERLVESETNANAEQVEAFRNGLLTMRKKACEQINELFDLNVSVDFRIQPPEVSADEQNNNDDKGDN